MKRRIRYHGFLIFLSVIAVIAGEKFFLASYTAHFTDYFTDILGVVLVLLGFVVRISARGYKAERSRQGKELITDGPYALTRNPMYLGILLIGTGVVLVIFKLWVFGLFLVCFLLFYYPQMRREERLLQDKFGDEFARYRREVPSFFPHPRQFARIRLKETFPLRRSWVKKEVVSFFFVLGAIFLFEIVEEKLVEGAPVLGEILVIGGVMCLTLLVLGIGYKN